MKLAIFWHRRDLRTYDNTGLYHALKGDLPVLPIFIFDRHILDKLDDKHDKRVTFIHHHVGRVAETYQKAGGAMHVAYGKPEDVWASLLETYDIGAVYTNHDYEPYAKERDAQIRQMLEARDIAFHTYKDQCIFEKDEVTKDDGLPYTVFTPYSKKWLKTLDPAQTDEGYRQRPSQDWLDHLAKVETQPIPTLESMGFAKADGVPLQPPNISEDKLAAYGQRREFPAQDGTTRISVHLRFGTVSIRQMTKLGLAHSQKWLNELIWRDFYMMILHHFPHVVEHNFRRKYDVVQWRDDPEAFQAWCEGRTGYPIVDAGMRELNETGFMHNRVRMVTACFLTKHLFLDWRLGEAYFGKKLLDYELSSNNGGWQWAAGTGTDAQPYFRVFNPTSQAQKFDKKMVYIKKWIPELLDGQYPAPIVEHSFARQRAIDAFKEALGNG